MELHSQKIRKLAPENDPLKIGMGWTVEDLDKPQIMVESTFGDSHPGSAHLNQFVEQAMKGIYDAGGRGARYITTDICDGISQGHDGINYSLAHRDMIANMIEIHGNSTGFDGGVFIASCDKSMPACLMGLCRLDMPSIVITGGVMDAGPDLLTLEQIGAYSAMCQRGEITEEKLNYYKHHACPSCGACSFMGTASTMQVTAEALGLMLPGTALMPATCQDLKDAAYQAGRQVLKLVELGLTPSKIVTMDSFENAIMIHAAISGSTNSLLHIPAIAHELGFLLLYSLQPDGTISYPKDQKYRTSEQTLYANEFAAELLMPVADFTRNCKSNAEKHDGKINVDDIAAAFGVTKSAALVRGGRLGIW